MGMMEMHNLHKITDDEVNLLTRSNIARCDIDTIGDMESDSGKCVVDDLDFSCAIRITPAI